MNPQETQQVTARDEKFQVAIDLVKKSSCFKAFTISAYVPEIFMQQFWYSIKKVQGTDSYEFLLANKKCTVNAEVFRIILDICPRVENVDFTDVLDDDTALTFLIELGYKGSLYKHTNVMFKRENVDYPELIWEYIAYQIDHRKEKRSRRENMPYPRFTINHFLKQHKSLTNLNYQHYHKIKDDGINRGIGSKGKKTIDDSQETVDVSEESEPEPESARKKISSKRRVKKKVTLSADDNIISDDLDAALELAKSISKTEAEEAEATRKVHATHARIVTEYAKRKSGGKSSKSVVIQDTPNIMQALKESKKTSKRQPGTRGSNERTRTKPGVPDESTVVSATSSEGTGTKHGVPDEEKDITKENVILEWGLEQESEYSEEDKLDDEEKDVKEGDADDEDAETKSDKDDIYKYKIHVRKDKDEEMINAEVNDSDKGDEEVTDAAKADAKKTSEVKDDPKKTELPPSSSSLSVSSGFGDQFLKLSSDSSLASTVKDTTNAEINSLLEVKIQSEVPHTQSPSILSVPVSMISKPIVLTPIQESHSKTTITTIPPPSVSTTPPLRVAKLEKDVFNLKKIDLSTEDLAAFKKKVSSVVDNYLGSKVGDVFQKELKKHITDLIRKYSLQQIPELPKKQTPTVDLEQELEKTPSEILKIKKEQAEKQKMSKFTIKSTDKAALKEFDLKSTLYQTMHANKSFNRNPANHRLYHALMEALIEDENAMDKGVADTVHDHKRKHDDEDPPAGLNQGKKTKRRKTKEFESSKKPSSTKETPKGKAPSKGSKTGKSASAMEPIGEPIAEVVMDDTGDNVARVLVELEYHFQECFNTLTDKLDWNNPEGDPHPFDLSKPLPLQGHPRHLTVTADYFFNNDLEYLKSSDLERTYTTSIMKTKAAQYEIEGIEDMVPTLWSPTKVGYGHLEEIMVKRADRQFYKFKEGDFVDLHLNDIEDMLLLAVQHKLFHLTNIDIIDFIMALCLFTRSLVIKKRVKDLQLGVKSYQKKLNITPPQ
ncbi:hypothetical protein Tco_0595052 [Tanacetum coccineum]